MSGEIFLLMAFDPNTRFVFFATVLVVVFSITLHELAHGWAAIRLGDRTPIIQNRMTFNPLIHMGPFSIVALLITGIAWGQMPIDPTRLKGRHGEAQVAFAGPAINLSLGLLFLIILGLIFRFDAQPDGHVGDNLTYMLLIAGQMNLILFVFNLIPAPPLDGSHILASYVQGYARFIYNANNQGACMLMFIGVFITAPVWMGQITRAVFNITTWVANVPLERLSLG